MGIVLGGRVFCPQSEAEVSTAKPSGTVTDPSGATIAGAQVAITIGRPGHRQPFYLQEQFSQVDFGKGNLQFRAEIYNLLNHTNFMPPNANNTVFDGSGNPVPGAGLIDQTTLTSRQIQFALKFAF